MTIYVKRQAFIAARITAGFSQRALAKAANLSSGYLSQIERGERSPSPQVARRLCDLLGVQFHDIFTLDTSIDAMTG